MIAFYLIVILYGSNSLPFSHLDFMKPKVESSGLLSKLKSNPQAFLSEVENLDPVDIKHIISLLEDLREESTTRETVLVDDLTAKNTALGTADDEVAAAVVAKDDADAAVVTAQGVLTQKELEAGTASGTLDDKKVIRAAKLAEQEVSQKNHDDEVPGLNDEQQVLTDVINMLSELHAKNSLAPTHAPTQAPTKFPTPAPTQSPTETPDEILLMKLKGGSNVFQFNAAYWTNDATLNPGETTASENDNVDAKLPAFNTQSFSKLRICYKTLTNCYTYDLGFTVNNARELFNSGFKRSNTMGTSLNAADAKRKWTDIFLPPGDGQYSYFWNGGSGSACGMQLPGINTICPDGNRARIGFCVNLPAQGCQHSDSNDADSSIGIGLNLQNWPGQINAPFGEYFLHGRDVAVYQHQAWLFAEA